MKQSNSYHTILGVTIHTYSLQKVLELVYTKLTSSNQKYSQHASYNASSGQFRAVLPIYTINPEFVVIANKHPGYMTVLNHAFIAVPDGTGILLGGLLRGKSFSMRITGLQLVFELTKLASEHNFKVGYLGGHDRSAEKTRSIFQKKYPSLNAWSDTGPEISISSLNSSKTLTNSIKIDQKDEKFSKMLEKIRSTDILFVAFGAPKQELFIDLLSSCQLSIVSDQTKDQRLKTDSRPLIAVGVGGSFDEISNSSPQTPTIIHRIGFKWLYRLTIEPWRWRRQLRLITFIKLIFTTKD